MSDPLTITIDRVDARERGMWTEGEERRGCACVRACVIDREHERRREHRLRGFPE